LATVTLTFQEPARVRYAELLSLLGWLGIAAIGVARLLLAAKLQAAITRFLSANPLDISEKSSDVV
jgi:hypothetical protein